MKYFPFLLIFICVYTFSQDSVSYNRYIKTYNNCDPNKEGCTFIKVKIDRVPGDILNSIIRDTVLKMLNYYNEDKVYTTIEDGMNAFIMSYEEDNRENSGSNLPWFREINGDIVNQRTDFISFVLSDFAYTGGAHPNGYSVYYNFYPDGRVIKLSDILKPGYEKELDKLLETKFRTMNDVKGSLTEFGLFVDTIHANNNFAFTKDGLLFLYNQYEIAPYSAGPIEILLSYKELQQLININNNIKLN